MTAKPNRAAIYARVSTQDQNPDMQLNELRTYAKARDLDIIYEFIDKESGAKQDRPELEKLLHSARDRKIDTVLVWKFDRFARSSKQLATALEEFQHLGVDFISKTEQIDTSSPTGRVIFHVISAFAEFERDMMRERTKAGIARARAQGKRHGRPPLSKASQEKVKKLRAQGLTYKEITKQTGIPDRTVRKYAKQKQEKS